ncbi:hypothetical protein MXB_5299 [Myxobolus squamalis]|nr:hypothetical protein MXB_5299 [Myxobolus squamalis]
MPWNTASSIIHDDVIEIFEKEKIILFGLKLNEVPNIELTSYERNYSDDCNNDRLPFLIPLYNASQDGATASIIIEKNDLFPSKIRLFICISYASNNTAWTHQGNSLAFIFSNKPFKLPLWAMISILIVLLGLSGLYSGLNLGLMALTPRELKLIKASGTTTEKKYAEQIYPIRKKGNILLCSILFGITVFNSASTVIIDSITPGIIAIVVSTICIVLFGELLPQSICSRFGLIISAHTTSITKLLMIVTWPVSFPLGKLLDYVLGNETPTSYNRNQLLEVLRMNKDSSLEKDEYDIILGGLKLRSKEVREIMTPLKDCYMVSESSLLDFQSVSDIFKSGFSRIPVYRDNNENIIGLLHLKDITFVDTEDAVPLTNILRFFNHTLIKVILDTTLDRLLSEFKKGIGHLAIVVEENRTESGFSSYSAIGLITLEDIIEEIIQSEILDEKDREKYKSTKQRMKQTNSFRMLSQQSNFPETIENPHFTDNMVSTICKFMSTSISVFSPKNISHEILSKIISRSGVVSSVKSNTSSMYIYENGVASDLFTLIIEGKVEVTVGIANFVYIEGAFSYYGQSCLDPELALKSIENEINLSKTFIPDFSVRILSNVLMVQISSAYYNSAVRSTKLSLNLTNLSFKSGQDDSNKTT